MVGKTALLDRIQALSIPEKLRLAAGLIEGGKSDLAQALIQDLPDELYAQRLIERRQGVPVGTIVWD